jgi:hypothetical protein
MKKDKFQEWIEQIKLRQWLQALSPVLAPVILFSIWLSFAKLDKRADILSKFIAMSEPIPTIDLSLPKPIVLASLYHATEDAIKMMEAVLEFFEELPTEIRKLFEDVKKDIEEKVGDVTEPIAKTVEEAQQLPWWVQGVYDLFGAGVKPAEKR